MESSLIPNNPYESAIYIHTSSTATDMEQVLSAKQDKMRNCLGHSSLNSREVMVTHWKNALLALRLPFTQSPEMSSTCLEIETRKTLTAFRGMTHLHCFPLL